MVEHGRNGKRFFNRVEDNCRIHYTLKSRRQYSAEQNREEKASKKYFEATNLTDLILEYPMPQKKMKEAEKDKGSYCGKSAIYAAAKLYLTEVQKRLLLVDFLKKVLQIDPLRRITPQEAKMHPFITGQLPAAATAESSLRRCSSTVTSSSVCTATDSDSKDLSNSCICSVSRPVLTESGDKQANFADINSPPPSPQSTADNSSKCVSTATNVPQSNINSAIASRTALDNTLDNEQYPRLRYRQPR